MKILEVLKEKTDVKVLNYFKNKFVFTALMFVIYALFLDDNDLFSMINHKYKLNKLEASKTEISVDLKKIKHTLNQLKYTSELERYAREEKFFKKQDEDIFVVTYE
ncbi:hypothetical protein N9E20_02345 [Crocinitomicaceae bacterium]|nr:hypothetical protein [Crocinitomicaceae bacterium]